MDKVDRYIERVQHLPPTPTVVTQLLGLFGDPNRDNERIAELISYDPSLTLEILKRCNSAFFRGSEASSDVFQAVSRLGFYEVHYVVAALVDARATFQAWVGPALDADRLWRHLVMTAVAAASLASEAHELEAKAFTAGLLHDVGKLVLAAFEGVAYTDLMRQSGGSGPALARAEAAGLGVTHAEVGARLLSRWGMPPDITLAVLHHHDSPSAAVQFERLAATVHLANILAAQMAGAETAALDLAASGQEAMSLLQLTSQDLPPIVEQARERLGRIWEVLRITV